jgi:uncharacterized protein (UPF0335 family)
LKDPTTESWSAFIFFKEVINMNKKQTQIAIEGLRYALERVSELNKEISTIAKVKSLKMEVNGSIFEVDFT